MHVKALMAFGLTWLAICSGTSFSAGLERSGQPITLLFENEQQLEFAHSRISPSASGTDTLGQDTGDVTQDYTLTHFGIKADLGRSLSGALIIDQPWGANLSYSDESVLYGGTQAKAQSLALTMLVHKPISKTLGMFSGMRVQRVEGSLTLGGAIFTSDQGYNVENRPDESFGYVAGFSYQKPELGLFFSLAYFSEIDHRLDANESNTTDSTTTKLTSPQAINIDFKTGISPTTLVFANLRWVDWTQFAFDPEALELEVADFKDDSYTYTLGIGRRFSPSWAGVFTYKHESKGDNVDSLFSPVNGYDLFSPSVIYTFTNKSKLTVGLSYSELGDSSADLRVASISFKNNDSLTFGAKVNIPF